MCLGSAAGGGMSNFGDGVLFGGGVGGGGDGSAAGGTGGLFSFWGESGLTIWSVCGTAEGSRLAKAGTSAGSRGSWAVLKAWMLCKYPVRSGWSDGLSSWKCSLNIGLWEMLGVPLGLYLEFGEGSGPGVRPGVKPGVKRRPGESTFPTSLWEYNLRDRGIEKSCTTFPRILGSKLSGRAGTRVLILRLTSSSLWF